MQKEASNGISPSPFLLGMARAILSNLNAPGLLLVSPQRHAQRCPIFLGQVSAFGGEHQLGEHP